MSPRDVAIAKRVALRALILSSLAAGAVGCGARVVSLPDDPGTPLPDFSDIYQQATRVCRGVRTFVGEIALAGRAGDERVRARVVAGFERPDAMRLEAVGPFGRAAMLLTAREGEAVLLLPRDNAVVRGARPEDILEAVTGVNLAPADILAVLTGCVVPVPEPVGGRLHANGWASIDVSGGGVVFLERSSGDWRALAARRDGWRIDYVEWAGLFPRVVRLQRQSATQSVDMTATLSQINSNTEDISPAAFTLVVPPDAQPISLDELRAAGPLGDRE